MADLIVIAILAAAVCGVIYKMRKDKKAGCAFSCDQRKEE